MRFNDPTNPATWLLASVLAIVLVTNAAWVIVRKYVVRRSFRSGPLAAAGWVATSLFYLLVPFVALQRGVISPYVLGLTEINWPATLSNGMVLAGTITGGLLFGWLVYRRANLTEGGAPTGEILPPGLARLLAVLRAPLDAALHQWHWTFYRAAVAGWLALPLGLPSAPLADRLLQGLQSQPLYWGAWLGILAVGVESALDPFRRNQTTRPSDRETAVRRAALAVATTGLFVLTRNFWLCLVVHAVVEMLAVGWFPLTLPETAQAD